MKKTIPVLSLLTSLLLPLGAQDGTQVLNELPKRGEKLPDRVKIALPAVEEGLQNRKNKLNKEEKAALAALTLASNARGYVPEEMGSIMKQGMEMALTVRVNGEVEITTEAQRINASGEISAPLVGSVTVANFSLEQIEQRMTSAYQEYFRDPVVNVVFAGDESNPHSSPWGYVTVIGSVESSGPLAMPSTRILSITGAIKLAEGFTDVANKDGIRIFRPIPEENSVERIKVNIDMLGKRGNQAEDILLRPGDVVFVPERIF